MKPKFLLAGLSILLGTLSIDTIAQTYTGHAVPFLTIAPDVRSSGMGEAGIATSPDVNGIFTNTGKLPFSERSGGISASYSPWLSNITNDVSFASVAGYYKPDEYQAFSVGLRYFNLGKIQFTSENNEDMGSSNPYEMAVNLGYARKLSNQLGLGLSMSYINSSILQGTSTVASMGKAGTAIAASLGLYYDNRDNYDNGWVFGAGLYNLGSKISYYRDAEHKDFLPASLGIGTSWNKVINEEHKLVFAADIKKLLVAPLTDSSNAGVLNHYNTPVAESWLKSFTDLPGQAGLSIGAEYWYQQLFAIRAGYFTETKSQGGKSYLTAGAGISFSNIEVGFSYLNTIGNSNNLINNTLRFGISYHFGEAENQR